LALWLAWCGQDRPQETIAVAAGALGSDTDTVATMAGALLGAVADSEPDGPIADRDLHVSEARRLYALSVGEQVESFAHPDPLHWQPPDALADALGIIDDQPVIAGLGGVTLEGDLIRGKQGSWQWASTHYGQRVLIKRRDELVELPDHARPRPRAPGPRMRSCATDAASPVAAQPQPELPDDPEQGALLAAGERFDARLVGTLWRHYASSPNGGAAKAAYFAALAAELYARENR
jgi:hypothetical protein